ncbi:MAG: hypothetical protein Q4G59_04430, partial [Planctomycetia bacterium]|nr:hypothetical protein [Planctomycetia bacterium]
MLVAAEILVFTIFCSVRLCSGQEEQASNLSAAHASLENVNWLLGDWAYDTTEVRMECSIRWSPSGNYI